jgi:low affinity Fe/Cu permease
MAGSAMIVRDRSRRSAASEGVVTAVFLSWVAWGIRRGMSTHQVAAGAKRRAPHMPSDVTPGLSFFDRFATHAAKFVSRAWFFAACLLLVVLWAPSILVIGDVNTWQLIINTATTIVTFLLVALLQNTQTRSDEATQDKLNAIAEAMSTLMAHTADIHDRAELREAVTELREAVGLEDKESA